MVEFLYWSAWRVGEAKALTWANVDETARSIRIEETKSGQPRALPYGALPQLVAVIERRRKITDAVQRDRHMVVTHVFHRNGEPIHFFRPRGSRRRRRPACLDGSSTT